MRILFLTNFYPPNALGGQGQSCQQVVEGMKQRGHSTLVLTSMLRVDNGPSEKNGIYRSLYLEMDFAPWRHGLTFFTNRKAREKHNLQCFERVYRQFDPDVVFIWGMWNLPRSLPAFIEARCPGRVVYRFAEYWPTLPSQHEFYWRAPGRKWYSRWPKSLVGHIARAMLAKDEQRYDLKFEHAICVSAATRKVLVEAGVPVSNARVIHTGLDIAQYFNGDEQEDSPGDENQELKLLYAGRLFATKGIETTLEAMAKLVFDQGLRGTKLSLAGAGPAEYKAHLRYSVSQAGLTDHVSFLGRVPSDEMPKLYRKFDVLLVPSTWPEPFARVVLEGMISGLTVVATPTGGTSEILVDGHNGLLFAPGDAEDLAQKIACLVTDPNLRRNLARAGQQTVKEKFSKTDMMDKIESYLQEVTNLTNVKNTSHSVEVDEVL